MYTYIHNLYIYICVPYMCSCTLDSWAFGEHKSPSCILASIYARMYATHPFMYAHLIVERLVNTSHLHPCDMHTRIHLCTHVCNASIYVCTFFLAFFFLPNTLCWSCVHRFLISVTPFLPSLLLFSPPAGNDAVMSSSKSPIYMYICMCVSVRCPQPLQSPLDICTYVCVWVCVVHSLFKVPYIYVHMYVCEYALSTDFVLPFLCSLTTECVLLLQNVFSYYRLCVAFLALIFCSRRRQCHLLFKVAVVK